MPNEVQVKWYNDEQTVIYATLPVRWTWHDAHQMIEQVYELQDTVNHTTAIIYDLRDLKPLPRSAILNIRRLVNSEHPNDGLNIIITHNTFLRQMLELVVRAFLDDRTIPAQLRFATTLHQAHAHLHAAEASALDSSAAN